ncbi:UV radiation resistance-associated gene protein isoform X1 [Solanum tuberosum]|uniref:UV radiation resistance-associated gene protein n=3 Tax=Solanum tuberosum TaxID=4113 RepID=M1CI59_SOLTU|nr:PREDICTED: UV radiation resistance-associated gene protein isoform X1 [Solanum tuberosum]
MESKKVASSGEIQNKKDKNLKIIHWEDYEQELVRLCSLTSALNEAKEKKELVQQKLQSFIQVEAESLSRLNELDEMREKLDSRKLVMGNMSMHSKVVKEKVKKQEEQLSNDIRSLLVAGTSLSAASKRLQDESRSLAGERGYGQLRTLQRVFRTRQQYMVSQVHMLYPVRVAIGQAPEQELEFFNNSSNSGDSAGSKPLDHGSLTIAGIHLTVFTKMSFFTDKKEVQRSATALGYVAHVVTLIASYLQVPLRYPLRFGGSRSYIRDYAPSIEPSSSDLISSSSVSTNSRPVEFPLFLEGQDSTRAAYAVFLLNKDIEQLLNYIGGRSLGPRHVLANLKELLRIILSSEYIDTSL